MRSRDGRPYLVVANWRDSSHPDAGGAEAVCEAIAREFAQRYRVVYLTADVAGRPRRESRDGYLVLRRGGRFSVYAWALAWLLRHRRDVCGVVDSQNGIPFFVPLVLPRKTPVVLLIHHVHQEQFGAYLSGPFAAIGRWLESTASRWVYRERTVAVVSPSTRRGARRQLRLRGDIVVVPPGLPELLRAYAPAERAPHERIVCVGRLVPHKRVELIVRAVPALVDLFPRLVLHIVGEGGERASLERLAAELGVAGSVELHGELPDAQRDDLLASAWLSVSASSGEGWGLTVLEANALGVPVLAFRRPGLRDSIRDGETGWLIDDDVDLAAAIGSALRQLADPRQAELIRTRAREWMARFTWDAMAHQLLGLLSTEADRLNLAPNRRAVTDVATTVHIPAESIPGWWRPSFRRTDKWELDGRGLVALLRGADVDAARVALRRCGLPAPIVADTSIALSVARPIDLIAPVRSVDGVTEASPSGVAANG